MRPSSWDRTDLRARAGASLPPGIRMQIDRCQPAGWDDTVMLELASETVTAATERSEDHALRPKRVADEPSVV